MSLHGIKLPKEHCGYMKRYLNHKETSPNGFHDKSLRNESFLRKIIAREAANFLYSGIEKEFKQAKLKAVKTLGINLLPSNLEVAIEVDKIADEHEGASRQERLIKMRREALELMQMLQEYSPLLVGSVWRGTTHYASDIDIIVRHDSPEEISEILKQNGIKVTHIERSFVTEKGAKSGSFHIHAETWTREKAEIMVTD